MSTNLNCPPASPSFKELIEVAARVTPPSVIVYGPKACGKTTHADALAEHYGLTRIVDDWFRPRNGTVPKATLILTNERPRGPFSIPVEIVRFEDAMAAIHDRIAEGQ